MKKIILASFILILANVSVVQAEEILDFDQTIILEKDGTMQIKEIISYDFGTELKHGIYRDIPFKYDARGGNYNLRIEDISVADSEGEAYDFRLEKSGNDKRIKIGKEEELLSGKHVYVLEYSVKRAINFFDNHDEIYWNVTGDKWPVEIKQAKSTVILPEVANENEMSMDCFSGPYGSTATCVSKRYVYEGAGMVKQVVFIDDILQAGYGFTITLGMPKGMIDEPTLLSKWIETLIDNMILGLLIILFFALFYYWNKHGRDRGAKHTIIAQFDAPIGLSPMGVGTLVDESADNKDFSANIISLAVKGHLKIVKTVVGKWFPKTDYALVTYLDEKAGLASETWPRLALVNSEEKILKAFFKEDNLEISSEKIAEIKTLAKVGGEVKVVLLSDLKEKFYKDLTKIKSDIYKELTTTGYFKGNPQNIRITYSIIGGIIMFVSVFAGAVAGLIATISLVLCGLIIIVFGFLMPAKTVKGVLAKEHILGLKEYLRVAEADRIKFHNAPEKNPEIFEKLLPFAMVLGVEKEWAKQFEDIYKDRQPDWYSGGAGHAFSAIALSDSMKAFSASASTAASSSPSSAASGGSGFSGGGSGGGFGGGGGGSW